MYSDSIRKLFNDNWLFAAPDIAEGLSPEQIPESTIQVSLPHAWNDVGWNYEKWLPTEPSGTGWYYKNLPACPAEQPIVIKFEGVSAECEVFLNGKLLYHNLGAYKPFVVALTDRLGDGTDLLAVRVTDKPSIEPLEPDENDPFTQSPRYKDWAVPLGSTDCAGGIWRDTWLISKSKAEMSTPKLHICDNTLEVNVEVDGTFDHIRCELYDAEGGKVAEASGGTRIVLEVDNPEMWTPGSPYLYSLQTKMFDTNGNELQCITQPAAFFELRVRDSEFYLNGKPYFLRGQNGFPHCNVPHDKPYIAAYVRKVKEQGVEISRFHTEPPCHAWLDECDRQGIMVIFEMPIHGSIGCYAFGNPVFAENTIEEICALVKEYRRHPSIALWSLGNEIIVASERNIGLGAPLFDILDGWCKAVHELDQRPIIANSGGDAVDLVQKNVGDVDDMHQYGGWYTENLRELDNYAYYSRKNEMVFQPVIVTESVAAYTNNDGEFMIHDETDIRQRKVVTMRLGTIKKLSEESMAMQSFILKEYAEAMWRLRKSDSKLSGYIPFGQYTWFFNPFDKDRLREKPVWDVYRKIMGPVHVQFECWDRHLGQGDSLHGRLLLCHEDITLPENCDFTIEVLFDGKNIFSKKVRVKYHNNFSCELALDIPAGAGDNRILINAYVDGQVKAENYLDFKVYNYSSPELKGVKVHAYDPAGKLNISANYLRKPGEITGYTPVDSVFLIGPFALDENVVAAAAEIRQWCSEGGKVVVLEQNPGPYSANILGTGINVVRKTQPYWSRWATNMTKHADRADICVPDHPMFKDINEADMSRWNIDTYLTHTFLTFTEDRNGNREGQVLSRVGNGLLPDELMPIEYDFLDSGYSQIAFELPVGSGSILISSLLVGSKAETDPVAGKILDNLAYGYTGDSSSKKHNGHKTKRSGALQEQLAYSV